jgi:hypothetical protein
MLNVPAIEVLRWASCEELAPTRVFNAVVDVINAASPYTPGRPDGER